MASDTQTSTVAPPQQQRSKATLERILEATERLLTERDLTDLTIAEIVREAKSSVGAFYKRFGEKDALLPYLISRHLDKQAEVARCFHEEVDWTDVPLEARIRRVFQFVVTGCRERGGLYRAIYMRQLMQVHSLEDWSERRGEATVERMIGWLLERREEITHPEPERAMRLALAMTHQVIYVEVLFSNRSRILRADMTDDALIEELVRAFLAYVGAPLQDERMTTATRTRRAARGREME